MAARDNLLTILRNSTIPKIHSRIAQIGPIGRTTNFGHGDTRNGVKDYVTNGRQPELFRALAELGNLVVPVGWDYNGITLNHGVLAKKHKDSKNLGPSIIIGIGDFQGGAIRVWDAADEDPQEFDLKDTPIMFNGGLLYHETVPFTGERYTIIYYKQLFEGKAAGVEMIGR